MSQTRASKKKRRCWQNVRWCERRKRRRTSCLRRQWISAGTLFRPRTVGSCVSTNKEFERKYRALMAHNPTRSSSIKKSRHEALRMRVFAGPNGSGKSTIIQAIHDYRINDIPIDFGIYVNADDIAESLKNDLFSFSKYSDSTTRKHLVAYSRHTRFFLLTIQCRII